MTSLKQRAQSTAAYQGILEWGNKHFVFYAATFETEWKWNSINESTQGRKFATG